MEETLPAAFAALFKETVQLPGLSAHAPGLRLSGRADERARQALAHYDRAIDRLKVGSWGAFGAELDRCARLLGELSRQPAAHSL